LPDRPGPAARQLPVSWTLSAHGRRLLTLAAAGLVLALLTQRPEFAGLAAPALLLLATWRPHPPRTLAVRIESVGRPIPEGETVPVRVGLDGQDGYETALRIVPAADITAGPEVIIPRGTDREGRPVRLLFQPERWGSRPPGAVQIVLRDYARLAEGRLPVSLPAIRCVPRPAGLQGTIVLSRLPARLGEHSARAAGEGGEFGGVREFVPGDRQRRINWPATTRLGTLHLSTFAAERIQNVVIIADITADVGEAGLTTLDLVLRGAAGAFTRYLAGRDRVGLVRYGGGLGWIGPGQGRRHADRLMDLLVQGPAAAERPSSVTRLPRAALPPGALILVFTPLLDPRLIETLRDLRERGFSVLVVDVLNSSPHHDGSTVSGLASRIWQLEQQAIRFSLTQIGIPVVHWDGTGGLDEPLAPFTRRVIAVRR
jgi:uncharacterized protein (DUF58 family)